LTASAARSATSSSSIANPGCLTRYDTGRGYWLHLAEIKEHHGYLESTDSIMRFRLARWPHALCWTGTDRPSVLFDRATAWLMDSMRIGIRRRDLFAFPSLRYADPRLSLLSGQAWESARPAVCCTLGFSTDALAEVARA
jgi:hypothetical protein